METTEHSWIRGMIKYITNYQEQEEHAVKAPYITAYVGEKNMSTDLYVSAMINWCLPTCVHV